MLDKEKSVQLEVLPRQRRYPGAYSFQDTEQDQKLFFGRQREVEQFVQQLRTTSLLVLYGKSGLGKTSLLNAGVFPLLRQHKLLPLHLRVNASGQSLLADIFQQIEQLCRQQGIDYSQGSKQGLWEHFKTSVFWRGRTRLIPVLILGQFEEIFTLQNNQRRAALAAQLGELLNGGLPASIRQRIKAGENLEYSEKLPSVKVVLSLRWEYVGRLEELFAAIPSILAQRFLLQPLSREQAEVAVVAPARQQQAVFISPPFEYNPVVLTELLDYLTGNEGVIEPYQLQLLCQHVERQVVAQNRKEKGLQTLQIEGNYLGGSSGMDTVLGRFYLSSIKHLTTRRARQAARELCEWGLLTREGHRLDMPDKRILEDFALHEDDLNILVDHRLLRREPKLGGYSYELAHDSLAEPILQLRRNKLSKKQRYGLFGGALIVLVIILSLLLLAMDRANKAQQAKLSEDKRNSVARDVLQAQLEENRRLREALATSDTQIASLIDQKTQLSQALNETRETLQNNEKHKTESNPDYDSVKSLSKQQSLTTDRSEKRNIISIREPEMLFIKPGKFLMGSDPSRDPAADASETPQHPVVFKRGFYIGKYEITFEEYDLFAVATGRELPEDQGWGRGRQPVINVSWQDAQAYADWLRQQTGKHFRLPSEAEWEYAARAGSATAYWWGNKLGQGKANCSGCGSQWNNKQTAPVGSFSANAFGLYDTAGNVFEWVQDCWQNNYTNAPDSGTAAEIKLCNQRVIRGGSWIFEPRVARSASRNGDFPANRNTNLGFRLAQDP